jgi:hypothetical protein
MAGGGFRTDVIVFISVSLIGPVGIFVVMSVEAFRTDETHRDKNNNVSSEASTDITTNIPTRPIRLAEIKTM